ncbi:MAG: hypothetical protein HC822_18555 [Oscillochloris sp.]|nr:hypothetical protein [Oscillochloris sp.]
MLHEIYIQQELQRVQNRRTEPAIKHRLALHDHLRRQAPLRRLSRRLGRALMQLGTRIHAYGADQPHRLSSPIPPIVDFRL